MRYEDRSRMQPIIALRPGHDGGRERGSAAAAACSPTRRPRLPALHRARPGRQRPGSGGVAEPGVPQGRHPRRTSRSSCSARSSSGDRAGCRSPTRSSRSSTVGQPRPRAARPGPKDCTPAASCRSTSGPAASPPNMQRALCAQALQQLPATIFDPLPEAVLRGPDSWPSRRDALVRGALSAGRHAASTRSTRFDTPAQRRLDLRGLLRLPGRPGAAPSPRTPQVAEAPACAHVDDRIRDAARAVLPFKLTAGQRDGAHGDRRRPAAPLADAAAAAGRRRRRQDDRRAAGGAGGDGERLPGRVHGADRNPGRAALPHHHAAAAGVAVSRRAAHRTRHGAAAPRSSCAADRSAARLHLVVGTHALVQERRRVHAARRWWSSTSSTASACCSGRRCAAQGLQPGRAGDDRDADSAHAGADRVRRSGRLGDPRPAAGPPADQDAWSSRTSRRDEVYAARARAARPAAARPT